MPHTVSLARHAMATRFEIVLHGERPEALRAAGEEALDEIERIENLLSLYRSHTEIADLNAHAAQRPVRVSPPVFRLLEQARRLSAETSGAFDITVGPLVRCWGFMGGTDGTPLPEAIAEARANVGMHFVELNPVDYTVRFAREGVLLDLGAIGKGYAIDQAAGFLRDAGVTSAILHGGTSTIFALGHPPEADAWKIALEKPGANADQPPSPLAIVPLRDEALSVSAIWGRAFQTQDKTYGHVIDPHTGEPVDRAVMAAVVLPSATETDALSTALLALGTAGLAAMTRLRPASRSLVLSRADGQFRAESTGIAVIA